MSTALFSDKLHAPRRKLYFSNWTSPGDWFHYSTGCLYSEHGFLIWRIPYLVESLFGRQKFSPWDHFMLSAQRSTTITFCSFVSLFTKDLKYFIDIIFHVMGPPSAINHIVHWDKIWQIFSDWFGPRSIFLTWERKRYLTKLQNSYTKKFLAKIYSFLLNGRK